MAWLGIASYPNNPQRLLTERRIAINVSKSSAIIFSRAGRHFIHSRSVTGFGKPTKWVDTTRYVGMTLEKRLIWTPYIDQVSRRTAQRLGLLGPLLNKKSDLFIRYGDLLYKQLIRQMMDYACPSGRYAAPRTSGGRRFYNPSASVLLREHPGTLVTGRYTRIWRFHYSQTTEP